MGNLAGSTKWAIRSPGSRAAEGSEAIAQMLIRVSQTASSPLAHPSERRCRLFPQSLVFRFLGQATEEFPQSLHLIRQRVQDRSRTALAEESDCLDAILAKLWVMQEAADVVIDTPRPRVGTLHKPDGRVRVDPPTLRIFRTCEKLAPKAQGDPLDARTGYPRHPRSRRTGPRPASSRVRTIPATFSCTHSSSVSSLRRMSAISESVVSRQSRARAGLSS